MSRAYGIRAERFEIKLIDQKYHVEFHVPALEKPISANWPFCGNKERTIPNFKVWQNYFEYPFTYYNYINQLALIVSVTDRKRTISNFKDCQSHFEFHFTCCNEIN